MEQVQEQVELETAKTALYLQKEIATLQQEMALRKMTHIQQRTLSSWEQVIKKLITKCVFWSKKTRNPQILSLLEMQKSEYHLMSERRQLLAWPISFGIVAKHYKMHLSTSQCGLISSRKCMNTRRGLWRSLLRSINCWPANDAKRCKADRSGTEVKLGLIELLL